MGLKRLHLSVNDLVNEAECVFCIGFIDIRGLHNLNTELNR